METTAEQIKRLEQELATLKEKERVEKEEAKKKAEKERDKELTTIKNMISAFNEKHDEDLRLVKYETYILRDNLFGNCVEHNYIEV